MIPRDWSKQKHEHCEDLCKYVKGPDEQQFHVAVDMGMEKQQ